MIAILFRDFIRNWIIKNGFVNNHVYHDAKTNNSNLISFHRNTATHHLQNHDQFNEENDV